MRVRALKDQEIARATSVENGKPERDVADVSPITTEEQSDAKVADSEELAVA